jgi:nucleoside-diphosphate-sugar epimerase
MQPILITGATGMFGRAFVRLCADRYLACHATSRACFGPWDEGNFVTATVRDLAAGRVVHAAGMMPREPCSP